MIIAEIGLNHLGQFSNIQKYIDSLKSSKIDAVSLQIREKEFYEGGNKNLLLKKEEYELASQLVKRSNKKFGIAIADESQIEFLESIGTDFYKIIRNDINNYSLVEKLSQTQKKVIVSTGLSSDYEISKFVENYGNENFVLNHTQLSYDVSDCNLAAISKMRKEYNLDVSFGNHCENKNVIYMSLCYDPSDILFYVKLDNKEEYPDNKHSLLIEEAILVAENIKILRNAIGDGVKISMKNKMENE